MEVSVGEYGRMVFEMTVGDRYHGPLPEHWESIRKEAEPLVRKLIALNAKMSNGGYEIHGYITKKKKKVLSDREKIALAQGQLLVDVGTLREGDYFWLYDHPDHEMYIGQDSPLIVEEVTKKAVYFEMHGMGSRYTEKVAPDTKVLKAPDFYREYDEQSSLFGKVPNEAIEKAQKEFYRKEGEFTSDEYWLAQYEKLNNERS